MSSHTHQDRVNSINRVLGKQPRLDSWRRDRLLLERRSLLRIIHDVPMAIQLPLDWEGPNPIHPGALDA